MHGLGEIWRRLLFLRRRRQFEDELEEEMRFHLEMKAQQIREKGITGEEAARAARRQFGNVTRLREHSREAWGWSVVERFAKDVRLSLRMLPKEPGFTALAVLTLGLGIGATTAIYSVIDGVLLHPLPYREADRLVAIWQTRKAADAARSAASYPNFEDWRAASQSFESITAATIPFHTTITEPEPDILPSCGVEREFFRVLGVEAARGRLFVPEDFKADAERVGVLSHAAWDRRFGRDPGILGRTIRANGRPRTIVGVLPPFFRHPAPNEGDPPPDLWIPFDFSAIKARGAGVMMVVARLKPGVPVALARTEMAGIGERLAAQHAANKGSAVELAAVSDVLVGKMRRPLWLLLGAVLLMLLCACVNLANLLLARSVERQREFAIRAALGGRRGLLFGQVIAEGLVLSAAGSALGILLAKFGVTWMMATAGGLIPRSEQVAVNGPALLFAVAVACASALLFASAPALVSSRVDMNVALKTGGRSSSGLAHGRMRKALAAAQVAVAVVLLTAAGLLLRSFRNVMDVDLGYSTRGVLTAEVSLPASRSLLPDLLARAAHLPDVEAAGAAGTAPLASNPTPALEFEIVGRPVAGERRTAAVIAATPGYFGAMRIALKRGRLFEERDGPQAPPVALVNEALARRHFGGENPVGKVLDVGRGSRNVVSGRVEIVGVVADVRQTDVLSQPRPQIWKPHAQCGWPSMTLAIRTTGDPGKLAGMLRAELRALDRTVPLANVRMAGAYYDDAVAQRRSAMLLLGALAALALVLSATGVYGVIACSVSQRTREIGIRMALGAQPAGVLGMVVRQGLIVASAGLAAGMLAALAAARLLANLLYGIAPHDPLTFGAVALLLAAVAALASYAPGRRATRVNPVAALRFE